MLDACAGLLIAAGLAFFIAGTVGLLRFADFYLRLHALTKADNLGLGLLLAGLALQSGSPRVALKLLVVWLLVLVASTTTCHLLARSGLAAGLVPRAGGDGG